MNWLSETDALAVVAVTWKAEPDAGEPSTSIALCVQPPTAEQLQPTLGASSKSPFTSNSSASARAAQRSTIARIRIAFRMLFLPCCCG
jgi:hypothetical protein